MSDREQVERQIAKETGLDFTNKHHIAANIPKDLLTLWSALVDARMKALDARAQWLEEACRVIESLKTGNHWQNDNTRDKCIEALRTAFQGGKQ